MRLTVKTMLFLAIFGFAFQAQAKTYFHEKCQTIPPCAEYIGELLEQHYVFDADIKGKMQATPSLAITKDNAELIFTNMLYSMGYSRVPLGQANTFQIMKHREARDSNIPVFKSDKESAPTLPGLWDLVTLQYKFSNPEMVKSAEKTCRSLLPASARVLVLEASGTIMVTEAASNLKKIYDILIELDIKPGAKAESKPETKSEIKSEIKADSKPEAKPEVKTEGKAEEKSEKKEESEKTEKTED